MIDAIMFQSLSLIFSCLHGTYSVHHNTAVHQLFPVFPLHVVRAEEFILSIRNAKKFALQKFGLKLHVHECGKIVNEHTVNQPHSQVFSSSHPRKQEREREGERPWG